MTTLAYRNGHLCIRYQDTRSDIPEITVLYWPILRTIEAEYAEHYGKTAHDENDGIYSVQAGSGPFSGWIRFRLTEGGQTKPIAQDAVPIPKPKVRKGIEVRYRYGRWEKLLKTGWTTA